MNKLICFIPLSLVFYADGQSGFNNTYGFEPDFISSSFQNVLIDNDTVVLFGTATPSSPPYLQGLLFVKMDTLGNVLLHKFHPDPDGDKFSAQPNYEITKSSDGGYLLTGSGILTNEGILVKLTHEGEINFYRKYGMPPNALSRKIRKVLETNDGLYLSGALTFNDRSIFLMKTDLQGNFIWEKLYGQTGIQDVMGSLVKKNNNRYAIGAGKSTNPGGPPYNTSNTWTRSWLLQVDSLGNISDSNESLLNSQNGIVGLNRLTNGWVYGTGAFEILSQFQWGTNCKIVRTGEDINDIIWEKVVSTTILAGNGMVDIKPTPDGNWVAVGNWITPIPEPPLSGPNFLGGYTCKFTDEGETIWSRLDTAFFHPDCGSANYVGGVEVLPSGSVFVVGYANSYCFDPERSYGWVLKISHDGCIDTLCTIANSHSTQPVKEIKIFPNPTTGLMNIENSNHYEAEVYDLFGRLVYRQAGLNNQIDITSLPDGVYILKIFDKENKLEIVNKIMKYR